MELLQDKSLIVALLALFGVLINAFVTAYNARKRTDIDKELIIVKSEIEKLNLSELTKKQADYNERLKKLEFELEQNSKLSERQIATGKKILNEIIDMFDEVEAIRFLRDHNFGGSFDRKEIAPLNRMLFYADDVKNRMLIQELEILRKDMVNKGRKLQCLIGQKTSPVNGTTRSSVLPDKYIDEPRPEWVEEAAKEINDAANEFVESYDEFVYKSRSILG